METRLSQFLEEISKIKTLLQVWNLKEADDWYNINQKAFLGTTCLVLHPSDHDYICNGHIEAIEKIVEENSNISWHTYHIDVTTICVEHKDGHMISAIAPQITLNFYMHDK